ncbi:15758_t:CDS:1, partial [Gigaspora margarita]
DDIRNSLSFFLPLKDHTQIRAVAIALCQIFKFDRLPEAYIAND